MAAPTPTSLLLVVCFVATLGVVSPIVLTEPRPSVLNPPTFFVTAPKRARYDTDTSICVSASNLSAPASIHLVLRAGAASQIVLNQTWINFTADGVQMWTVVIRSERMFELQQSVVQILAEYRSITAVKEISMNPLSGILLIQTDKVIYTPRQTVMYRVIALDDDQKFSPWPVTVDIKNPDFIILDRQHFPSEDAFRGRNFTLPRDATPGNWTIEAYFDGSKVRTRESQTFAVREYELPLFKAEVGTDEKIIGNRTHWIRLRVKAMYSFGAAVQGVLRLRMGVAWESFVTFFNQTYTGALNSSGHWHQDVSVRDLRSSGILIPDGSRLFLQVNVTENGTGEMQSAASINTFFANPFYRISFDGSKKYFKPGFPYNLVVDVKAANGDPASNIRLFTIIAMRDENGHFVPGAGRSTTFTLDENGRISESINIPDGAAILKFEVYTLDPRVLDYAHEEFDVNLFASTTNSYLHLEKENGGIRLRFTALEDRGSVSKITVMLTSKGRLIYNASVPRTGSGSAFLPLPPEVLRLATPSARVVAYYYVSGGEGELVSDSLYFENPDQCLEELQIGGSFHMLGEQVVKMPGDQETLTIQGGGGMRVGLLAVDKAVYFLRDERSLTREKMFKTLDQADEGRGIGDGNDSEKIFEFSGLQFMKLTESLAPSMVQGRLLVEPAFDISRLNHHLFLDVRKGQQILRAHDESNDMETIPFEDIRKYFPESWLFYDLTLPESGFAFEDITLPDTITTWAFSAVGVGRNGGVCMSRPHDLVVFKPFFTKVRVPYKAVRLEEVAVDIGIYNYQHFPVNVTVTVTGDIGVCFSEGYGGQQRVQYRATVPVNGTNNDFVRVIPLLAGSVTLTVDVVSANGLTRDTVRKVLHVVAEGRRVMKSITFPLDPTGRHSSHQARNRRGIQRTTTATVENLIDHRNHNQRTKVDLYMPQEIIQGSERCQISACGDLMGDIISTSVMEGDNLFESKVADAEEAIGNLAPAVHALLYLNHSQILTPLVAEKGRAFITHGVSRLLTYRKQDGGSFGLTPTSEPATWLTALVLKTLCQAERITFIHHDMLVEEGIQWLLRQVNRDGTLREQDRRLARPSQDYDLMLSAEVLIALHECAASASRPLTDLDLQLMRQQETLLGEHLQEMTTPLVMAKTAYALTLSDPQGTATLDAVQRLSNMKRINIQDLHYWSDTSENEPQRRPSWYHSGTRASSIEATAYALLVFALQTREWTDYALEFGAEGDDPPEWNVNLDSIAGWLIQKRNSRGAFIGAMDTAVATQGLSGYSLSKQSQHEEVNLHCNVTTSPRRNYTHSFDFNEHNAIMPKSLSNVPVGRQLHIETRGTGLGQMQVRVEYNIPVEANADCRYNLTITRRPISFSFNRRAGDPVCQYCDMGCDRGSSSSSSDHRITARHSRSTRDVRKNRVRRQQNERIASSLVSICIEVCLRSTEGVDSDRTILNIGMLTGFQPYKEDLQRIIDRRNEMSITGLVWDPETSSVEIKFTQVPHNRTQCISFRAKERVDVSRRNPAIVTVRPHEEQEPTCVAAYEPVVSEVNLAVYCANNQTSNQGQCRCFSGLCGTCLSQSDQLNLGDVRDLFCQSSYVYKIQQRPSSSSGDWVDMRADVLSIEKNADGGDDTRLHLVTPTTCSCPHRATYGSRSHLYFFGSRVDTFVNRNNRRRKTYVIDQSTTFTLANSHTRDWIRMANSSTCSN